MTHSIPKTQDPNHSTVLAPLETIHTKKAHMFARLNQVARHLSRPLPNYLHQSAAAIAAPMSSITGIKMAEANGKRTINTAACLIIGDEVLGGKVGLLFFFSFLECLRSLREP